MKKIIYLIILMVVFLGVNIFAAQWTNYPTVTSLFGTETILVGTSTNNQLITVNNLLTNVNAATVRTITPQQITNTLPSIATTNWVISGYYQLANPSNYVTATVTNGLATTNWTALTFYPTSNPSAFVTTSVTNGLATTNWVVANSALLAGTNTFTGTNTFNGVTWQTNIAWFGSAKQSYIDGAGQFSGHAAAASVASGVNLDSGNPATQIVATGAGSTFTTAGVGTAVTNLLTGTNALNAAQIVGTFTNNTSGNAATATNALNVATGITNAWQTYSQGVTNGYPWTNIVMQQAVHATNADVAGTVASIATNVLTSAQVTNVLPAILTNYAGDVNNVNGSVTASNAVFGGGGTGTLGLNVGAGMLVVTNGNVGIGATNPPEKLTVIGNQTLSGTLSVSNDVTLVGAASDLVVGGNVTINGTLSATNTFISGTTTMPTASATGGWLWNSNQVLYWVTSTKTNVISDGGIVTPIAAVPIVADWYLHFTNGSVGSVMTVQMLTNGTTPKTIALFSKTGSSIALGGHTNNLRSPVTVGNTTFPVDFANRSAVLTNTSSTDYIQFEPTIGTPRKVTFAGFIYCSPTNNSGTSQSFGYYVVQGIGTGQFASLQINAGSSGTNYFLNVESNPGGITIHGPGVVVSPKTWYWVSYFVDYNIGSNRVDVFDASTGSSIGSAVSTNASGENIYPLKILYNAGSGFSGSPTIEHTVIAVGDNAIHPLGP